MSIVGPRPHAMAQSEKYKELLAKYSVRRQVKPGITGWAQINGYRGETEDSGSMQERVELDIDYVRKRSLAMYFKVIFKTIILTFRSME
jgi:lipopolysaccharide/colanic/teichoic acid biosynthesis glycosyltransferase